MMCADLLDVAITDASVVVLNFTLQFVPQEKREALIRRIAAGLRPGGMLILSEKIHFEDQALNNLSVQYIFTVKAGFGSFSEAAVSSDDLSAQASSFTRRSKRNSVTFSRLPSGVATASYRVEIATRKPAFVLGQTKPSRSAQFTIP